MKKKANGRQKVCSGRFRSIYKLPCRHEFDVESPNMPISLQLVDRRWFISSDVDKEVEDMCPAVTESQLTDSAGISTRDVNSLVTSALYKLEHVLNTCDDKSRKMYTVKQIEEWYNESEKSNSQPILKPSSQLKSTGTFLITYVKLALT